MDSNDMAKLNAQIKSNLQDNEMNCSIQYGDVLIDFTYKKNLSYAETVQMYTDIRNIVFVNGVDYNPQLKSFAVIYAFIVYHTDITVPNNINDAWPLVMDSGLIDVILEKVGNDEYSYMAKTSHDMIEYYKQKILKYSRFDDLIDVVIGAIDKVVDKLGEFGAPELIDIIERIVTLNNQEIEKDTGENDNG